MPGRLEPEPLPRRDLLSLAGLWSAGIAIFGSILGMARLPNPRVLPEASGSVKLAYPSAYPAGSIKDYPEHRVRVISTDQGLAAISLVCTHLGCIVSPNDYGYHCPCHGSRFDHQGHVLGGPAPRPLKWLPVTLAADGAVIVDTKGDVPPGSYYEV